MAKAHQDDDYTREVKYTRVEHALCGKDVFLERNGSLLKEEDFNECSAEDLLSV